MSDSGRPDMGRPKNHIGPLGYYWFLTFEHATELRSLAGECQAAIDVPGFAPAPLDSLHLTLDRIAYPRECSQDELNAIANAAEQACEKLQAFDTAIAGIANMHGALVFDMSPAERIEQLRDTLRVATLSAYPEARIKETTSDPHVTIAYPAAEYVSIAETRALINCLTKSTHGTKVTISDLAMVALERLDGSYTWKVIARITLAMP